MNSALEEGEWSAARPGRNLPPARTSTHCTGDWVGSRAGLDKRGKSRPPPGFDPRTVQTVVSSYTDWATRPTLLSISSKIILYHQSSKIICPWNVDVWNFMALVICWKYACNRLNWKLLFSDENNRLVPFARHYYNHFLNIMLNITHYVTTV
jgi:hypothetical protein